MNIEYVNNLIESGSMPFIVAILLGLISAVSPCPLTTNISALGYIAKNISSSRRVLLDGIYYALGRVITYTILGSISIFLIRAGTSIAPISDFLNTYGESILPPVLFIMALITLDVFHFHRHNHNHSHSHRHTVSDENRKNSRYGKGGFGAFLMGLVFALAFCPINGMFFFGMLAPMAARAEWGYFMPVVYGLITGLPVVIISWFLAYSVGHIESLHGKMAKIEKWCRILVATMLFIFAGYFAHHAYFSDGCEHDHGHNTECTIEHKH